MQQRLELVVPRSVDPKLADHSQAARLHQAAVQVVVLPIELLFAASPPAARIATIVPAPI